MTAAAEIRRAAAVLFEPGQVVEVRAFAESGRPRSGYFDDLDLLAEKVDMLTADPAIVGTYWTINPCDPDLLARRYNSIGPARETTTDAGIVRRRWLLVDADPVRPSGISATDDEKAAAVARADAVASYLAGLEWPEPVRVDSGNGCHLYYRVDLPADADPGDPRILVHGCLEALASRFSDERVKIDTSVGNAARIARVPGTPNRKGANMPDRPHRPARLIAVPDESAVVPVEKLRALADEATPADRVTPMTGVTLTSHSPPPTGAGGFDLRAWIDRHGDRLAEKGYRLTEKPKADHRYFAEIEPCPWSSDHATGAFIGQLGHGGVYARCQHDSCGGAGGPNRWREFRQSIEPPKLAGPKKADEEADEVSRLTVSFFEKDGGLYLVAMTEADGFGFVHLDADGSIGFVPSVTLDDGTTIEPRRLAIHQDSGELMRVVGIPRIDLIQKVPLLDARELIRQMGEHICRYADLPDIEREMGAYYALFSWFYTKRATSPYLRYIGDTGTGKSRCARVVVDLCFLPLLLSGGTSPSALMRQHEKWRGTVLIEEADLAGDMSSPVIKWLNVGFERGAWIMLSDKNDPNRQQAFQPWGPKVIAMRTPFRDNATEARCLSYSPRETKRKDIPAELPQEYHTAVADLRAKIARFVLAHWRDFDPEWVIGVEEIEPRIRQMSEPVSCILQYVPDGEERYRRYVQARQREVRRTRAESREGAFFNEALSLAMGEVDADPVEAVTPRMVADSFKTSPTAVTSALKSIGFTIERERIVVRSEHGETRKKMVRKLAVPSVEVWDEIVSRYYFDPDGAPAPDCPDALRGSLFRCRSTLSTDPFARWDRGDSCVGEVSQLSHPSHNHDHEAEAVTPVTVVTLTLHSPPVHRGGDTAPMPDLSRFVCVQSNPHPCRLCGAERSHYVASASDALIVDMTDPANIYLCRRCWHGLADSATESVGSVCEVVGGCDGHALAPLLASTGGGTT